MNIIREFALAMTVIGAASAAGAATVAVDLDQLASGVHDQTLGPVTFSGWVDDGEARAATVDVDGGFVGALRLTFFGQAIVDVFAGRSGTGDVLARHEERRGWAEPDHGTFHRRFGPFASPAMLLNPGSAVFAFDGLAASFTVTMAYDRGPGQSAAFFTEFGYETLERADIPTNPVPASLALLPLALGALAGLRRRAG